MAAIGFRPVRWTPTSVGVAGGRAVEVVFLTAAKSHRSCGLERLTRLPSGVLIYVGHGGGPWANGDTPGDGGNDLTDPTNPTDPTDPTDPADPTDPTDPTDLTRRP